MNKTLFQPIAYALILIIGIQLGYKLNNSLHRGKNPFAENEHLSISPSQSIEEVFQYINAKYVDTINTQQLASEVIKNTLAELDPHSSYISVTELGAVNEDLEGNFDGIGVEFSIVKDTVLVITPLSGGPSEIVGVLPGDKIVSVNDSVIVGKNLTNAVIVSLLRGEKGSKVNIGVKRGNAPQLLAFTITRDEIPMNSVDIGYMLNKQTGYIKVNRFSANTYNEFGKELYDLTEAGMKNLILDLRGNPGGYLDAAYKMLDELVAGKEVLVYTQGRTQRRHDYISKISGLFEMGNLAILIDEGSASAAEIMAGAVQDLDRGILVGRRTFGKGLVQQQIELSDGSAMRLTVARYYTPSGRCIQKPYEKGNKKAYEQELLERYEDGEVYTPADTQKDTLKVVADSLKYYTRYGRLVQGSGGVEPDFYSAIDTSQTLSFYKLRSNIPDFVYEYFSQNQKDLMQFSDPKTFEQNFDAYNNDILKEFENYALKQKIEFTPQDISNNKKEFNTVIKAYIARQRWGNKGFYPIINTLDETLNLAIQKIEQLDIESFIKNRLQTQQAANTAKNGQ